MDLSPKAKGAKLQVDTAASGLLGQAIRIRPFPLISSVNATGYYTSPF